VTVQPEPIPSDPRDWRPQSLRDGLDPARIQNPIGEPLWEGVRVLAHYRDVEQPDEWGTVDVFDTQGGDARDEAQRAFDQLRRSIRASDAVLDGVVTIQAWRPGVEIDFGGRERAADGDAAFVALDLLRVDHEDLFDVPLLERKRLLDGLIDQSPLVRVSPWTMPPLASYFRTWRRAGFAGIVLKAANSRYLPGSTSMDWTYSKKEPDF